VNAKRILSFLLETVFALPLLVVGQAFAQPTYSVDVQGPTFVSGVASGSDILTPVGAGMVSPPAIAIPGGALGVGPTAPGFDELDALSYGRDPLLLNQPLVRHRWSFSVDEFAVGQPGVPGPSVTTEGAGGPVGEASADVYATLTLSGPTGVAIGGNSGVFDGNGGATPFLAPGLNLFEPNPPSPFTTDGGDNLDAWDIDTPPPVVVSGQAYTTPVYFSLDSSFGDPLESPLYNTGTAIVNGFVGGDVLVTSTAFGAPALYASAASLGLDTTGTDTDDLDALVLWDNGDGVYQPTDGPYSWAGGLTDMLLYSVRRGSALIGSLDAILGVPIEEGDILVPFAFSTPGIFIPAEVLGLATLRTNGATGTFQGFADDLDALDVLEFIVVIPEPGTLLLACMGLVGIVSTRRRLT